VFDGVSASLYDRTVLYGRDTEIAVIDELVGLARTGTGGALVVRGAPGLGKSALLREARSRAGDMEILTARGIEAESDLPFAGLHQLLHPVWQGVDQSSDHARTALRSALGMGTGSGNERFLVYTGCLNVLSEVAESRPVMCLVDDAHWLDSASAEALQFVARRLEREPIVMIFAARDLDERRFDGADLPSISVAPLDAATAATVLRRTTEIAAEGVATRILAQARGNPLALIELPRALTDGQLTGVTPLPDELPMTAQLEAAFSERIARLPEPTRRLLLVAATDDSEDVRLVVRAAATMGVDAGALDLAERAGLVEVRANRIEFRHPLVRSALSGKASSADRRAAHAAIATAMEGDEEQIDRRAWHLAASAVSPDDAIVSQLEEVAARAERRGGHIAAARALERAGELSIDPARRATSFVHAARNLSVMGRDDQAVALLNTVDARLLAAPRRATAAYIRASAAIRSQGRPVDCIPDLTATARELAPSHASLAVGLLPVATFAAWQAWDRNAQLEIARITATIDSETLGEPHRQFARSIAGFAAMLEGDPATGQRLLEETVAWGRGLEDPQYVIWASWAALWLGDENAFDELLRRAAAIARSRGEIGALTESLGMHAVQLALLHQRYDESAIAANEAVDLARDLRSEMLTLLPRSALAIIAAIRGDVEFARGHGEDVVRLARERGHPFRASPALYALAMLEMVEGRWNQALDQLSQITETNDPALAIAAPEIVEAAVRAGRPGQAAVAFELYERRAGFGDQRAVRPRLTSAGALLMSGDGVSVQLEAALALAADARPFDRPRIELLAGEHLRRLGRRQDAREPLRSAISGFDRIGAVAWADRARRELQATGESVRPRSPDAIMQLTPQELQIARLVGEGLTNKEVAAQLYLSPRTIDAHLRGVFAKLGITSRRELRALTPTS
jgi:DNA-binding CsgD family transcriptional regulator